MLSPSLIKTIGVAALLLVLCVILVPLSEGNFSKAENIQNLISRTSMYGILAIGVAFVIMSGGIDLSIGSVVCLIACLLALFLQVSYDANDALSVGYASQKQSTVIVAGHTDLFQPGDTVRYFGSRRARTLVTQVSSVKQTHGTVDAGSDSFVEDANVGIDCTIVTLNQAPSRSNDSGMLAKTYPVSSLTRVLDDHQSPIDETVIELAGYDASRVRVNDKVQLIATEGNRLKEAKVIAVDQGRITINQGLDESEQAGLRVVHTSRHPRMSVWLALGLVSLVAVGLGLLHGVLVAYVKLQPFIVTLCGLLIYRGAARWIVADQPVGFGGEYTHSLSLLAKGKLQLTQDFGLPYPALVLLAVGIAAAVFLNLTVWGRYLLAMGRNEEAATYSGIRTHWILVAAYVIGVCLSAIGGVLFALEYDSVSPSSFGNAYELYAIAAAVLGGCSLRGGEGSILGVVLGTAVLQVLNNMIVLAKISDTLELAVIGMVILLGVLADEVGRRVLAALRAKKTANAPVEG
ncbi:MAG: ABC transporter permease [Pirellulaceae bacterium]